MNKLEVKLPCLAVQYATAVTEYDLSVICLMLKKLVTFLLSVQSTEHLFLYAT